MQLQPINPHALVFFPVEPALGDPTLASHGINIETGTSTLEVYHENAFAVTPFEKQDPQDPNKIKYRGWIVTRFTKEDTELPLNNRLKLPASHVVALRIKRLFVNNEWSYGASRLPWLQDSVFRYKPSNLNDHTYFVERKLKS